MRSLPALPAVPAGLIFADTRRFHEVPRAMQEGAAIARAARASGLIDIRAEGRSGAEEADRVGRAIDAFRTHYDGRVDALQATIEGQAVTLAALGLNGAGAGVTAGPAADPAYSTAFATFMRNGRDQEAVNAAQETGGRAQIRAAMSVGSPSDGGYIAPVEWDRKINQAQLALSPMRRLANVVSTNVGGYSTLWNNAQWGSGWVGETAARPQTSTANLSVITFPTGEIYAQPAVTQRLLDDALVDMADFIGTQLATEFARQEGIAFVAGLGGNQPMGFLQYVPGGLAAAAVVDGNGNVTTPAMPGAHPGGNLDVKPSGAAATIQADALVDFFYGLASPYRPNATWLMSSTTAAVIAKLKDGQGNYLWRDAFVADQPPTLLGRPVTIDENMPAVAAGNLAIALGDFRAGYVINDRLGIRILRDPFTMKPYVLFYATKRVGGGVADPRAIRVMKIAAS